MHKVFGRRIWRVEILSCSGRSGYRHHGGSKKRPHGCSLGESSSCTSRRIPCSNRHEGAGRNSKVLQFWNVRHRLQLVDGLPHKVRRYEP
jgi:hypothetical protein